MSAASSSARGELDVWTDRDRARPDERVHDPQVGAEGRQQLGDAYGRRLAGVAGVLLVGQAEQQQASALDRAPFVVERQRDASSHVVGHVLVDVVGQLDEPERVAELPLDLPGQVARVDRQAVAADAGARREPMKPNGLVAAASMTSQMSMPSSWANIASSLTRAMLTWRNVFSSSLASSATFGLETGTTRSTMLA